MTAKDTGYYDGRNVVFGYIADKKSQAIIDDIMEEAGNDEQTRLTGKPTHKVVIAKCGKLKKK